MNIYLIKNTQEIGFYFVQINGSKDIYEIKAVVGRTL